MDVEAQELKLNYDGGSLAMPLGNMRSLFGDGSNLLLQDGVDYSKEIPGHPRVRVIGQPSVQVKAHTRSYTQWPTSQASNAAAGRTCQMRWTGSEGWWTARYTGAAADLGSYLQASAANPVEFVTSRGTKYGPYRGVIDGN